MDGVQIDNIKISRGNYFGSWGVLVLRDVTLPRETRCIGAGEERGRQGWLGPSEGRVTGPQGGPEKEYELMRMKCMTEGPRGVLVGLHGLIGVLRRPSSHCNPVYCWVPPALVSQDLTAMNPGAPLNFAALLLTLVTHLTLYWPTPS